MLQSSPIAATAADVRVLSHKARYSICTLVNDFEQYGRMRRSFEAGGFTTPICEYLYLDNTSINRFDAYTGLNIFLRAAQARYAIICHQDVELIADGMLKLDRLIEELDALDPAWGVAGNAGALESGRLAIRISDLHGENQSSVEAFPVRAVSIDENFMVVRQEANLAVSRDLYGYHLYGAELSLVAERLGYHVYVVDFHLRHHGRGNIDNSFYEARLALMSKCKNFCSWRWLTTTCTEIPITSLAFVQRLAASKRGTRVLKFLMKMRRWAAVMLNLEPRSQRIGPSTACEGARTSARSICQSISNALGLRAK